MHLPRFDDEAAFRALDKKCRDPKSVVSKRTVAQAASGHSSAADVLHAHMPLRL